MIDGRFYSFIKKIHNEHGEYQLVHYNQEDCCGLYSEHDNQFRLYIMSKNIVVLYTMNMTIIFRLYIMIKKIAAVYTVNMIINLGCT
jgi:hypothetical protein